MEQNINYQHISLKTHISIENVTYLFEKQFDKLNKIKTNSFISIIQREMNIDLAELKEEADKYYSNTKESPSILAAEYKEKTQNEKKKKFILTISALVLVFIIGLIIFTIYRPEFTQSENIVEETKELMIVPLEKEQEVKEEVKEILNNHNNIIDNKTQEAKQNTQNELEVNTNAIKEAEETSSSNVEQKIEELSKKEEPIIEKSIKVTSKYDVWAGIQYLDNLKTKETTAKEIIFDPNRDFVATFGHNVVQIITHDNQYDFKNDKKKRRISYIDGKVEIITKKKLNQIIRDIKANR